MSDDARYLDPDTSHAAARRAARGRGARLDEILRTFRHHPAGLTDDELCGILMRENQRRWPTIKTARSRLSRRSTNPDGILIDSTLRRHGQIVWTIDPERWYE